MKQFKFPHFLQFNHYQQIIQYTCNFTIIPLSCQISIFFNIRFNPTFIVAIYMYMLFLVIHFHLYIFLHFLVSYFHNIYYLISRMSSNYCQSKLLLTSAMKIGRMNNAYGNRHHLVVKSLEF